MGDEVCVCIYICAQCTQREMKLSNNILSVLSIEASQSLCNIFLPFLLSFLLVLVVLYMGIVGITLEYHKFFFSLPQLMLFLLPVKTPKPHILSSTKQLLNNSSNHVLGPILEYEIHLEFSLLRIVVIFYDVKSSITFDRGFDCMRWLLNVKSSIT